MINSSYDNFMRDVKGKKCVVFGLMVEEIVAEFKEVSFSYVVDNNFWKWGSKSGGLLIEPPHVLERENPEDVVVLITLADVFDAVQYIRGFGIQHIYAYRFFFEHHCAKRPYNEMFKLSKQLHPYLF